MSRVFLSVVGSAYLALALWCVVKPGQTSQAVGFDLAPGVGQSEYLTVYGGLQMALGVVFLSAAIRRQHLDSALQTCLMVHGGLVLFRSVSLVVFHGFSSTTYALAAVEWLIFLAAWGVWWRRPAASSAV